MRPAAASGRRRRLLTKEASRGPAATTKVAPRSHGSGRRGDSRLLPSLGKPHRYTESRMDRPPPHVHGKEGVVGLSPTEGFGLLPARRAFLLSVPARCGRFGAHRASTNVHRALRRGCRAAGLHARGRRGRGRSGGRTWSGSHPCSGRGRRWSCRHGARRSRRCAVDRRCAGTARSRQRAGPASSRGCGSCAGRGCRRGARTRPGRWGPERGRARRADRRARCSSPSRRG
jgi:hypothetical protein